MKKNLMKIFKSILIAAAAGVLFELLLAGGSYLKAGEMRGIHKIKDTQIQAAEIEKQDGQYIVSEKGGKIEINLPDIYIGKLQYGYECPFFVDATFSVYDNRGNMVQENDKLMQGLTRSVADINDKVSKIVIELPESGHVVKLKEFIIDNKFKPNPLRAGFISLAVFLGAFLWMLRRELNQNLHVIILVSILAIGTYTAILQPPYFISWDEHIHFRNSYELGVTKQGENLPVSVQHLWGYVQQMSAPQITIEEKYDIMRMMNTLDQTAGVEIDGYKFKMSSVGYFPQALSLKIGTMLGIPFCFIWILGRIAGVITYALLMYWAIKIIPAGRMILSVIALLPTVIFLSTSYTYDTFVTSFIILGISILLKGMLSEGKISKKEQIAFIACMVLGSMSKAVYAPLLLTAFVWDKDKFASRKEQRTFRIWLVAAVAALMSTFILPVLLAPKATGDIRGGNTSNSGQMAFIFGHPWEYTKILLSNIFRTLTEYNFGNTTLNHFAYLGKGESVSYALLAGGVILTDTYKETNCRTVLNKKQKVISAMMIFCVISLIWTALYIDFTEVGRAEIAGVQGRYYLPFLPLVYFLFKTDKITAQFKQEHYQMAVLVISIGLLLFNVGKFMLIPLGM